MAIFKKKVNDTQTGAALIEFAIVVPLLLLLVVGIIEFSYAFYHLNILNKSVQDGARYFADPLRARANGASSNLTWPINSDTATNPNVAKTKNLVIYGNTAVPSPCAPSTSPPCPLMPTAAGNYTLNVTNPDANHIMVTATYRHNFILGNALNQLTRGAIPNSYNLTASSVLRVE